MGPWWALLPAAATLFTGAYLSYQKWARDAGWFPWVIAACWTTNALLWVWAARRVPGGNRELYSLSVAWDVITLAAFNVLPLVLAGVRLGPTAFAGLLMVVAGAVLVKAGG